MGAGHLILLFRLCVWAVVVAVAHSQTAMQNQVLVSPFSGTQPVGQPHVTSGGFGAPPPAATNNFGPVQATTAPPVQGGYGGGYGAPPVQGGYGRGGYGNVVVSNGNGGGGYGNAPAGSVGMIASAAPASVVAAGYGNGGGGFGSAPVMAAQPAVAPSPGVASASAPPPYSHQPIHGSGGVQYSVAL
eukprot:TRINITY_DN7644_c0_g1_i3.p2 TRINITY_DN7644_c0_g1~~TRINITY_DN7644_c0_g1_i3.p2  ORF type:complete len:187 (-),score=28.16 TRINITY_DN7644_c0_g1_i3:319-879(-)